MNKFPSYSLIFKKICEVPQKGSFDRLVIDAVQEIDDSFSEDVIKQHLPAIEDFCKKDKHGLIEFNDAENFVEIKSDPQYLDFKEKLDTLSDKDFATLCCDILNKNEKVDMNLVQDNSLEDTLTIDIKGYVEDRILGRIHIYSQVKCCSKNIGLNPMKQFVGGVVKHIMDENRSLVHPYFLTYFSKNGYDEKATEYAEKIGVKCYDSHNLYDFCREYAIDLTKYQKEF